MRLYTSCVYIYDYKAIYSIYYSAVGDTFCLNGRYRAVDATRHKIRKTFPVQNL